MSYETVCPNCGRPLQPFVGPADHAPWVCYSQTGGCDRAWWTRELEPDAQAAWDQATASHVGLDVEFRLHVAAELDAALARGTSARPDQLPHLPLDVLERVAGRKSLDPTFARVARAALKQRQGRG